MNSIFEMIMARQNEIDAAFTKVTKTGSTGGAACSSFGGLSHYASAGVVRGVSGDDGAASTAGQSKYGAGIGANGYYIIEDYA
ncbi:hypothetical protein [Rahnella bonaserana]|uniref:Uncharacterized protein n=1 Tax=Rahnella bonaserana TaxID=2816248 RepID=A0ABS6LQ17_9GAMM|nr:hypothetical protein [Rahnella bonaserana]MBU9854220.1 hypothetical protein [Rahnella bonaserana]